MPSIKLENFSGTIPRTGPTQLPDNAAQIAKNVRLTSLELRSWQKETRVYQPVTNNVQSIYRLTNEATGASVWLEWAANVDVAPSPIADDTDFRIYYTGDTAPKKTNWVLATSSGLGSPPFPDAWLYLGVPAPTTAPTLVSTGSGGTAETRAYVYTYISTFGAVTEESAPSPAATVNTHVSGSTVTVSGFAAAPTTGYNITHCRIYRTVTGGATVSYQLVAEIPIATASYADTLAVANLGPLLQTQSWNTPPTDLQGIVSMPNGMMAGFRDNEVWFAEPYYPHAWPDLYTLVVDSRIVGLGVYDTTLVVLTERQPYLITGSSPLAMSQTKLPVPQPCVSKRSIVSDQFGVLYASPNGLVSISPSGVDVISQRLYTRIEWQALNPSSIQAMLYNNQYVGFYTVGVETNAIVLIRNDIPPLSQLTFSGRAPYVDKSTGNIYAVSTIDNDIYQLDASVIDNSLFEWKSKQFVMASPTNFGVLKVRADYDLISNTNVYNQLIQAIIAANTALWATSSSNLQGVINSTPLNVYTLNGSILMDLPNIADTRSVNIFVYAEGVLIYQAAMTSNEPVRMPAGQKAYIWEVLISGNVPVRMFGMATDVTELKSLVE
jgi:hypothetical protein